VNDVPLVSIIVVNYNAKPYLASCLESIFRQTYPRFEVWLVDNASSDGSLELVRDWFPQVKIIQNKENVGFAAAVNQAVACAQGEFIALLNPDAIVSEDWLYLLVAALNTGKIALVTADLETLKPGSTYGRGSSLNILGYNVRSVFDDPYMTFFASGCCLMYRKDQIVGPFDSDYFAYYEDVLLSWQLRLTGQAIRRVPEAKVTHRGGGSWPDDLRPLQLYYNERNRLLTLLTCYSALTLLKLAPLLGLDILWSLIHNLPKNLLRRGRPVSAFLSAYWWLIRNCNLIKRKRRATQQLRRVDDAAIMRYQTYKVSQNDGLAGRLTNWLAARYCSLVGLRTWELSDSHS